KSRRDTALSVSPQTATLSWSCEICSSCSLSALTTLVACRSTPTLSTSALDQNTKPPSNAAVATKTTNTEPSTTSENERPDPVLVDCIGFCQGGNAGDTVLSQALPTRYPPRSKLKYQARKLKAHALSLNSTSRSCVKLAS